MSLRNLRSLKTKPNDVYIAPPNDPISSSGGLMSDHVD